MLVSESIESFKRGLSSKDALGVGKYRKIYDLQFPQDWDNFLDSGTYIIKSSQLGKMDPFMKVYWDNTNKGFKLYEKPPWAFSEKEAIKKGVESVLYDIKEFPVFPVEWAKLIPDYTNESVNFTRGQTSKDSLNIGLNKKIYPPFDWLDIPSGMYLISIDNGNEYNILYWNQKKNLGKFSDASYSIQKVMSLDLLYEVNNDILNDFDDLLDWAKRIETPKHLINQGYPEW